MEQAQTKPLKIALINPPLSAEEHYGSLKEMSPDLPLLGIAFISSYLNKFGFNIDLLDHGLMSFSQSLEILKSYDVIGFSAFITNYNVIIQLAEKLKNNRNIIIVGGPHATLFPYDFTNSAIDYVISGEGELPLKEILVSITENRHVNHLAGLGYNKNGNFVYNSKSAIISNLDVIGPPDNKKYDLRKYYPPVHIRGKRVIHTLTSRGCSFKCSFCAASEVMGRRMRYRGLSSVIEELKYYKDLGCDSVMFYDDLFTLNKRRLNRFCNELIKHNMKFKWSCFTRTDCLSSDMCKAMKESGCYLITFGCESANDKTLKLLNKGLSHEDNIRGINMANNAKILTCSSFMIGLPGETENDILNTIDFAKKSNLTFAVFPIFEPFKGTPIFEKCKEMGEWKIIEGKSNQLLLNQDAVWVPRDLERSQVVLLARKSFKDVYLEPKRMIKVIKHVLFSLPPQRLFRFSKGGLSFFSKSLKKSESQHYTHY